MYVTNGEQAASGVLPFPGWEEQSFGDTIVPELEHSALLPVALGVRREAWPGGGAFKGGQMRFFHSWRSPTLTPQCALAYEGRGGWAQTAKTECCARGILKLLLAGQVTCSGSNYLNIFTGDERNESARKGGMGRKNCFSNRNEVIKKPLKTWNPLYTASLPLLLHQVLLVFTNEHWGDYISLIIPGSICKCTNTLKISVCQLSSSMLHPVF